MTTTTAVLITVVCLLEYAATYKVEDHTKGDDVQTSLWAVKVKNSELLSEQEAETKAQGIAFHHGLVNLGMIGRLHGHFLFSAPNHTHLPSLLHHKDVEFHEQQSLLRRSKRDLAFQDPLYPEQWHLKNLNLGLDLNVTDVWEQGVTGSGIVVAVVDDGVEWKHPDLINNYEPKGSFDLNDDDDDPTPKKDKKLENKHGTRCAGEIAATPNNICGVGVAYGAKFSGIRILDGLLTDSVEAVAFGKKMDINDIYSCSWGPEDDGKTVDGPHWLANKALQHGVLAGRDGFGSIFFVASGNGGTKEDNCNYDGYASSIYTITVAAVDENGRTPSYAERCASMMTSSLSNGYGTGRIVTTDWSYSSQGLCTREFSGTSAATPLAAGVVALMLEARPCLTWRDVRHIIAMTSSRDLLDDDEFVVNKAGFAHSDWHGFGLLDAWRAVRAARVWQTVPWMTSYTREYEDTSHVIPIDGKPLTLSSYVSAGEAAGSLLSTIEHIVVLVSVSHQRRGALKFTITCPSGTRSLIPTRPRDKSDGGLVKWDFMTVKCWGESPVGKFQLKVVDTRRKNKKNQITSGVLTGWKLIIYGSSMTSEGLQQRRVMVKQSYGSDSNYTAPPCPLGQKLMFDTTTMISARTLKLVALLSAFFVFWAVYNLVESIYCSADLKRSSLAQASDVHLQQQQFGYNTMTTSTTTSEQQSQPEHIQMVDLEAGPQESNS